MQHCVRESLPSLFLHVSLWAPQRITRRTPLRYSGTFCTAFKSPGDNNSSLVFLLHRLRLHINFATVRYHEHPLSTYCVRKLGAVCMLLSDPRPDEFFGSSTTANDGRQLRSFVFRFYSTSCVLTHSSTDCNCMTLQTRIHRRCLLYYRTSGGKKKKKNPPNSLLTRRFLICYSLHSVLPCV